MICPQFLCTTSSASLLKHFIGPLGRRWPGTCGWGLKTSCKNYRALTCGELGVEDASKGGFPMFSLSFSHIFPTFGFLAVFHDPKWTCGGALGLAAVVASYTKPNFSPDPAGCTRIFPRLVYCTYMYILHHIAQK